MQRIGPTLKEFWSQLTAVRRTRKTVRGQLMRVVALTTASALLVAGSAMLWHDLYNYRLTWSGDLATQASIMSLSTAPALAFDDHAAAGRNLEALQTRRRIQAAALYLPDGTLFAQLCGRDSIRRRLTPMQRLMCRRFPVSA